MPYGDGIVTDRDAIVAEGTFPTMALNTPTTDPTFGLTYTVIADNTFDPEEGTSTTSVPTVEYSHLSAFNADSTRVWLSDRGGVFVGDWNPTTMQASNWLRMSGFRAESFYFSRTDPDVAYSIDSATFKKILKRDFSTDTTSTFKDFTSVLAGGGSLKQMSVSEDTDDTFAFTYNDGSVEKEYIVWRASTDDILVQEGMTGDPDINEIHINDTGEYAIAYGYDNTARILRFSGAGGTTITRWELGDLWDGFGSAENAGVAGMGHSDVGRDGIVGTDADATNIYFSRWSDLLTSLAAFRSNSIMIFDGQENYSHGMHVCYRGNDKSWAMVNFYDVSADALEPTTNELVLVKVDIPNEESMEIQRVQKGRGERGAGAWAYEEVYKGSISPDGRFIAFTTNNLATGRTYVVVTKIADESEATPTFYRLVL